MAKELKLNLPPADDLFTTQEERDDAKRERVIDLPLNEIHDFPNHPFKVRMDEDMLEMTESVKKYGVLVPGLVRPRDGGGYEMVAGHRRKMASGLAERGTMPCLIRDLTDDEAIIIMVDSNLQREKILPSEKALAYKMKLEAMKRQGQRTDLTSVPVAQKSGKTSRAIVGEAAGESQDQVRRYIRLTELIPQVLDMVDAGKIAMRPAVQGAFCPAVPQLWRRLRHRGHPQAYTGADLPGAARHTAQSTAENGTVQGRTPYGKTHDRASRPVFLLPLPHGRLTEKTGTKP